MALQHMVSNTTVEGFTLTLESPDSKTELTVESSEEIDQARKLLDSYADNAFKDEDSGADAVLNSFRRLHSGSVRSDKIYAVIKQYAPISRVKVGKHLFGQEISHKDPHYKELCNNWPHERVETAETDDRTPLYQPKGFEEDDDRDYPELKDTGYTEDEFKRLKRTGQSEVVIQALLWLQPCNIETVCREIFNSGESDRTSVRHILNEYWKNVVEEQERGDETVYSVNENVEIKSDAHAMYKLWKIMKPEEMFRCIDCSKSFDKTGEAKKHRKHRKHHGHINWKLRATPGIVKDWIKNNEEQEASSA
jgi:hypothetical protein